MVDGTRPAADRELNPTQQEFIFSSEFASAYMGAAGCAKTSTLVAKTLLRSITQPGTTHMIGRYDYNDLKDTTMKRAEEMLTRLPPGTLLDRDKSPPAKWYLKSIPRIDATGELREDPSQIIFMGLKEKFGSYEFNTVTVDEADETDEKDVLWLIGRLRNPVPWKSETKGGINALSLAFNPPDTMHWLYTACTGLDHTGKRVKDPWLKLYLPQARENIRNLPENYYEMMAQTMPEDMLQRLRDGQWGSVFPGEAVYKQFRRKLHVVDRIEYVEGATLFRFWDFGFNFPAVLWAMVDVNNTVYFMRELLGRQEEITHFAERVKAVTAQHFPGAGKFAPIRDYGDPAVKQKKDTGQALATLHKAGITVHVKHTPFEQSINLFKKHLETLIEGHAAIQIDKGCAMLIGGLAGGYRLKDDGVTPHKDGFYDHLMDAARYGLWNVLGPEMGSSAHQVPTSVAYDPSQDV